MKKTALSRRKFLTGMGLAAGSSALLAPALKNLGAGAKNKQGSLLEAWTKPQQAADPTIRPIQTLIRKPGSHLLPLANRPF